MYQQRNQGGTRPGFCIHPSIQPVSSLQEIWDVGKVSYGVWSGWRGGVLLLVKEDLRADLLYPDVQNPRQPV